jgi:KaiC/GvpD/RAD55 family RecA-like ATPase
MKQVPTGIDGLDKMLNGGLPAGRCILACGGPGSGKTILSWQFLYYGAVRYNEPGLYVSLDEDTGQLKEELGSFGWSMEKSQLKEEITSLSWEIEKLEKDEKLGIVDASPIRRMPGKVKIGDLSIGKRDFSLISLLGFIENKAKKIKAKRIVIDPITALTLQYNDVSERRTAILDLFEALSKLGTTNLITTELRRVTLEREIDAEEFLAHGVVLLHVFVSDKEIVRGIQIEKMRGIAHDDQIRPYKITENGIEVFAQEKSLIGIPITTSALQS